MHGLVRCIHRVQVFTHVQGGCDNHRCHNKKTQIGNELGMWMTSCPEAMVMDSLLFWIKAVSWDLDLDEASWFFGPEWGQSSYGLRSVHARWLSQWVESWRWKNSQHRKIVSLSPRVENLNLKKVIKVSYLYQKSHQCFVFFGFRVYISRIRILVLSWICYNYFYLFKVIW